MRFRSWITFEQGADPETEQSDCACLSIVNRLSYIVYEAVPKPPIPAPVLIVYHVGPIYLPSACAHHTNSLPIISHTYIQKYEFHPEV